MTEIVHPKPLVFISYTHDSKEHKSKVLNLAERLRADGKVNCELDQFHESPPQGWPRWMTAQIEEASYVLVICTEKYSLRFRGKEEVGKGKGAKWEGAVITQQLYDAEQNNIKFIPVLLKPEDEKHIPVVLRGATYYDLSQKDGYTTLLERLTGESLGEPDPEVVIPMRKFANEISTKVAYYTALLGSWPVSSFSGKEHIEPLLETIGKVEANVKYREAFPNVWATLHRMVGGAYLIHGELEMPDKLGAALRHLHRSHEIWPEQHGFEENIRVLERFLRDGQCDVKEYMTTVLQILRGPADPEIPGLVDRMFPGPQDPAMQAQSWLLHNATPKSIWPFLQAVQLRLKMETKLDPEIEIATRILPNNDVEVTAKIGPNVFSWEVDFARKKFEPKNELTKGFMGIIERASV